MYKLMPVIAACFALSGCASNDLSVKTDSYSGKKVVSSEYFHSLTPLDTWSEMDRVAFKYDFIAQSNIVTLRAGYLTGTKGITVVRGAISNINGIDFMIDGNEHSYQSKMQTNYNGLKVCNEESTCSVFDGSSNSFSIPLSLLNEIKEAKTVKVKLTFGSYGKVALLKHYDEKSDAYNELLKFDEFIKTKLP